MDSPIKRSKILKISIHSVAEEELSKAAVHALTSGLNRQIILLGFHDFMKARYNKEFGDSVRKAALVIPTSPLIPWAARCLKEPALTVWHPYPFVIRLLAVLEEHHSSIYLLGSTGGGIKKVEARVRSSFPGLRVVGRYAARFPVQREQDIIMAIRKSSPSLLLMGKGLRGKGLWAYRNQVNFSPGLSLYEGSCYKVFSGQRSKKPHTGVFHSSIKGFFQALIRPWRFLRLFKYLWFFLLVFFASLKRKE